MYHWEGYRALFEAARAVGFTLQAVMSFHACGGNVGDSTQIPLPHWVLQVERIKAHHLSWASDRGMHVWLLPAQ